MDKASKELAFKKKARAWKHPGVRGPLFCGSNDKSYYAVTIVLADFVFSVIEVWDKSVREWDLALSPVLQVTEVGSCFRSLKLIEL